MINIVAVAVAIISFVYIFVIRLFCSASPLEMNSDNLQGSPQPPSDYDVIVVGLGAAGTTAATTLARVDRRVLALEASARQGGRVHTVDCGNGVIELGAEWIHGTERSPSYDLAVKNNISLMSQRLDFTVFRSDGSEIDSVLFNTLIGFVMEVIENPPEAPEQLGQYVTRRVNDHLMSNYPQLYNDKDFVDNFLQFLDQFTNNYEASNSWNDVSTSSNYRELAGDQHMSWNRYGYRTLFEIMMNTYKGGPGLPSLTVKFNSEVTQIKWPQHHTGPVEVTTKDGTVYTAEHVIVTVSLGVLKEKHTSLFTPALPQSKLAVIDFMSIGVMDKIELRFAEAWWPKQADFFGFIWTKRDREAVLAADVWTTKIFGASCPLGQRKVLTLWTSGDTAKLVEILPEEEVRRKSMALIRKFMRADAPEPLEMHRSAWFSNPYTRGSYSYDNLQTPAFPAARSVLAAPLSDAEGTPRVLFAGEATNPIHFSTVHGAMETGAREAVTLLTKAKL